MSGQIFKKDVPKNIMLDFLEGCAVKKNGFYIFTKTLFKAAKFNNLIAPFCKKLVDYYYKSKRIYVTRHMSYTNFNTVLRQVCNNSKLIFTSNIEYEKSTYEIVYNIFYDQV